MDSLCAAAAWLLRSGGSFSVVHRPERLCDLFFAMRSHGLEPKRLRLVRHTARVPVSLILAEARRNARAGLQIEPDLVQFCADGTETAEYRRIYHHEEAEA